MPPPRKKRPPAGQPVPGMGTISAHRDALRRSSGAAVQKPPGRGRKNSPGRGPGLCTGCAIGERRAWGFWCREASHWVPARAEGTPGRKNSPRRGRGLCADCADGETAGNGGVWCREVTARAARRGREHIQAQKQPPAGAGGCLDAGYGCYLPRAIRVIWMHRVGSTARPRIMPS